MQEAKTIGIIMDGNRRWALENGLSKLSGHQYGIKKILEVVNWSIEEKVKNLIFYAFSTENWNRSKIEIKAIMLLFQGFMKNEVEKIIEKKFQ